MVRLQQSSEAVLGHCANPVETFVETDSTTNWPREAGRVGLINKTSSGWWRVCVLMYVHVCEYVSVSEGKPAAESNECRTASHRPASS